MPPSRIPVFALLLVAILGAGWLWWSSASSGPPVAPASIEPPAAEVGDGSVDADTGGADSAHSDAGEVARTEANATEAAAAAPNATLNVTATWPEAVPAEGVMIYLHGAERGMPYTAFARGLTDEQGLVVFTDVPPGKVAIQSDRGDGNRITVVAGGQEVAFELKAGLAVITVVAGGQEVAFELKAGLAVTGTVLDPNGRRVASASVWLQSSNPRWNGGRVMTRTDARGEFALQHCNPAYSLGAIAAGFGPSKLVDLELADTSTSPVVVELKLEGSGGRLEGTVTDTEGAPIEGALIAVATDNLPLKHFGDRVVECWTSRTAETDENGFFAIDGLAMGTSEIAIRAAGYGLHREEVTITAGQTTAINPHLPASSVIHGTVTDGQGNPIEKARVSVFDIAPITVFISGGNIGFGELFGHLGHESDAAGRYRIEGVTPGTAHVFAQRVEPRADGVSVAFTNTTLDVAPGTEKAWNPEITDGRTVEGVVLYRDGFPMKDVFLTLVDERTNKERIMTNDNNGMFRWHCLEASLYTLRVQYWDAPKGTPPLRATGIIPDRGQVELRATYDKPVKGKGGKITGRIDDVGGRIRNEKAVHVVLNYGSNSRSFREVKVENGAYVFEKVSPGKFRITLVETACVLTQTDWFELPPAGEVEAPILRTEAAGAAKITLVRPEGTEALEPKIYLKRVGDGRSTLVEAGRGTECASDNLTPGQYKITGYATGMVALRGEMTVHATVTTELSMTLQAGALVRISVWWPEGKTSANRQYRILDEHGKVFHEVDDVIWSSAPLRPYPVRQTMPPGRYSIEFSTDTGLRGEREFEVPSVGGEIEVRVDLQ